MVRVFISYSHADVEFRRQLTKHFAPLDREGLVDLWDDRCIPAGDDFDRAIRDELENADVVLLLVSADFLSSDYCHEIEMRRALERNRLGECRVIPVILRPCDWTNSPISHLLATPTDGLAISKHEDPDDAYLDVVRSLRAALSSKSPTESSSPEPSGSPNAKQTPRSPGARSNNLQVTKAFGDYERDLFRSQAFDYFCDYFQNSLAALETENSELQCQFRKVDANTMTATVYLNGTRRSGCSIRQSPSFPAISYSADESSPAGTMNEWLSVEDGGAELFLKPGGMGMGGQVDSNLSHADAAAYFWSIIMEPLQRR